MEVSKLDEAQMRPASDSVTACNFYRDRDGFCLLTNRCWDGKRCPTTQAQADRARIALVNEIIRSRALARPKPEGK